jgi:hypothetical protein
MYSVCKYLVMSPRTCPAGKWAKELRHRCNAQLFANVQRFANHQPCYAYSSIPYENER